MFECLRGQSSALQLKASVSSPTFQPPHIFKMSAAAAAPKMSAKAPKTKASSTMTREALEVLAPHLSSDMPPFVMDEQLRRQLENKVIYSPALKGVPNNIKQLQVQRPLSMFKAANSTILWARVHPSVSFRCEQAVILEVSEGGAFKNGSRLVKIQMKDGEFQQCMSAVSELIQASALGMLPCTPPNKFFDSFKTDTAEFVFERNGMINGDIGGDVRKYVGATVNFYVQPTSFKFTGDTWSSIKFKIVSFQTDGDFTPAEPEETVMKAAPRKKKTLRKTTSAPALADDEAIASDGESNSSVASSVVSEGEEEKSPLKRLKAGL